MIDLHMHTTYSDGTDDVITILKKAEEKKLEYISITDHNNCDAYYELEKINIKDYYTGKIIPGIELNTKALDIPIEVLGYNIDPKKMNELLKDVYVSTTERNIIEVKRLYDKCKKEGIYLDDNFVEKYDPSIYASQYLHKFITKNNSNKELIDEDAWENSNVFYRKYMSNPKTKFFVDTSDILPDFATVMNLIKQAGGLIFIPHIYEYRTNSERILKYILDNFDIDGIECYYTTFTEEQNKYLLNLSKERNLFISGGSDYHGSFKPDVDMATGKGNLNIPNNIIDAWKIQ